MSEELLRQALGLLPARGTMEVRIDRHFPYESTNPEKPGMVHAVAINGVLICSREMYAALRAESDKAKIEDDDTSPKSGEIAFGDSHEY